MHEKTFKFQAAISLRLSETGDGKFEIFAETDFRSEHLPVDDGSFQAKIFADKANFLAARLPDELQRAVDRLLAAENIRGNWIGNAGEKKREKKIRQLNNEDASALRALVPAKRGHKKGSFSEAEKQDFITRFKRASTRISGKQTRTAFAKQLYKNEDTKQLRRDLDKFQLSFDDLIQKPDKILVQK